MNSNPYATPESHVDDPHGTPAEVNLFNAQGRIGRMRFVSYNTALVVLFYLAMGMMVLMTGGNNPFAGSDPSTGGIALGVIILGLVVTLTIFNIFYIIKRLHDLNSSGWLCLLSLIPLINFILYLFLLFASGTTGPNDYGNPPVANSLGVKIIFALSMLMVVLTFIGIVAGALSGARA